MKSKIIKYIIISIVFSLVSGNIWAQETTKKSEELKAGMRVKNDLVCMVNDSYMGQEQIPVAFEDKTYYGCCAGCVKTIKNKRSVRYSIDPATDKEVDKAKAYITLQKNGSRKVHYFASEETYKQYQKKDQISWAK